MATETTNFGADSLANSPDVVKPVQEQPLRVSIKNEGQERLKKLPDNMEIKPETDTNETNETIVENEDSIQQGEKKEETNEFGKGDEKQCSYDQGNMDKKVKRAAKKKKKVKADNSKSNDDPDVENEAKSSKKTRMKKSKKKQEKSKGVVEEAVEKKAKVLEKEKHDDNCTESKTSRSIPNLGSASHESITSEKSKKSNNIFAATVAPGLAAEKPKKGRRRKKPKMENDGVDNPGAENEEENNVENATDDTKCEVNTDVRKSPSLKEKTGNNCCSFWCVSPVISLCLA